MKKLIIFDLDGTLLDTSRDIQRVLNASLEKFGLPKITYAQTLRFVGDGAKKLVERAVGQSRHFKEVYADYSAEFAACDNALTRLYDGEDGALTRLAKLGVKFAVVTNKPQRAAENVCAQYLSAYAIDCVAGGADGPLKPDPALTLAVIGRSGFNKEECLFVGDGETDVLTARAAGVDCVSVLWGFRGKEELAAAGATRFARDFKELENYVLTL